MFSRHRKKIGFIEEKKWKITESDVLRRRKIRQAFKIIEIDGMRNENKIPFAKKFEFD